MATINDVYNEIDRIEAAKEAIEDAIEERGVEIQEGARLGDIPQKIREIPGPVQADWSQEDSTAPDYIKNKPTIPAAQVQSDWAEQDSEKVAFIKNKPTIPTVPKMSTNIADDKNSNTKTASAKAVYDAVNPAIESIQPAAGMLPNVLYNFGQLSNNIAFLLGTISDASIVNHFYWVFETGSSVPTITWPSGLSWFGGSAPQIAANKHYEISVLNGVGVAMEV